MKSGEGKFRNASLLLLSKGRHNHVCRQYLFIENMPIYLVNTYMYIYCILAAQADRYGPACCCFYCFPPSLPPSVRRSISTCPVLFRRACVDAAPRVSNPDILVPFSHSRTAATGRKKSQGTLAAHPCNPPPPHSPSFPSLSIQLEREKIF